MYDIAQVCRNGHVINSRASARPERKQKYCSLCGEETITTCDACKTAIQGSYETGRWSFPYRRPAYCHACGKPYPWTSSKLKAAKELAATFEELSGGEQTELQHSVDDLVRDTPRAKAAESRVKQLLHKAGKQATESMRGILVDVLSEAVKKSLFP
jgi:hypothetical protein